MRAADGLLDVFIDRIDFFAELALLFFQRVDFALQGVLLFGEDVDVVHQRERLALFAALVLKAPVLFQKVLVGLLRLAPLLLELAGNFLVQRLAARFELRDGPQVFDAACHNAVRLQPPDQGRFFGNARDDFFKKALIVDPAVDRFGKQRNDAVKVLVVGLDAL